MKRICLVTHTEATHSVDRKVGGWFDSVLTKKGEEEASLLPEKIRGYGFDINRVNVYSSDLQRAVRTAEIIVKNSTASLILDSRLREMSFGTHEGMDQQKHDRIIVPINPFGERLDHEICEGSETRRDVAKRLTEFLTEIMDKEGDMLVVTHGFAATFFIAAFQKIAIESMGYIHFKLRPGSISILEEEDLFGNRSIILLNG